MNDIENQSWSFGLGDVLSVFVLVIVAAIPVLGWFFGLKFGAILLAESIKRKRSMVWLATAAAALPATVGLAYLAVALEKASDPLLLILFGYAPLAILLTSITGVWVELRRNKSRRARREVEAA